MMIKCIQIMHHRYTIIILIKNTIPDMVQKLILHKAKMTRKNIISENILSFKLVIKELRVMGVRIQSLKSIALHKKTHHFYQNEQIPVKYWSMRHMLFPKFDNGIQLDLGFYSVCPDVLSYHTVKHCKNNIVLDPFCGVGGNIIQLTMICIKDIIITMQYNIYTLSSERMCCRPTKIGFSAHLLTSLYHRETSFDSREMQEDAQNQRVLSLNRTIICFNKIIYLVIVVDIDPNKIKIAHHNAEIYGVTDKIEFIVGDIFLIYSKLKTSVVYMSLPWGGPGYSLSKSYSIKTMCNDHVEGGLSIFDIVKNIASNIEFHMPKYTNILECVLLAKEFGKVYVCFIKNLITNFIKLEKNNTITKYLKMISYPIQFYIHVLGEKCLDFPQRFLDLDSYISHFSQACSLLMLFILIITFISFADKSSQKLSSWKLGFVISRSETTETHHIHIFKIDNRRSL
ncbi:hypothetical protein AGLY_003852 [Aphis glycines]|uniref:Trimethylguanosine synthase n=1 Tax=Aphis glycines TaxID=307491 RepID=A0A6G0TZW1_APHGL|nr:hypothetical protein AGLY_003852 [Aphis glycines]